jgi:hypothetical protein
VLAAVGIKDAGYQSLHPWTPAYAGATHWGSSVCLVTEIRRVDGLSWRTPHDLLKRDDTHDRRPTLTVFFEPQRPALTELSRPLTVVPIVPITAMIAIKMTPLSELDPENETVG